MYRVARENQIAESVHSANGMVFSWQVGLRLIVHGNRERTVQTAARRRLQVFAESPHVNSTVCTSFCLFLFRAPPLC